MNLKEIDHQDLDGNTALHLAVKIPTEHSVKMISALLSERSDIRIANNDGNSVLHFCVLFQRTELLDRFVSYDRSCLE